MGDDGSDVDPHSGEGRAAAFQRALAPTQLPKRFYTHVEVTPAPAEPSRALQSGWTFQLDGQPVRTPSGGQLAVPTKRLIDAVAAEWRAQGERIDAGTMPITRLANTAIDRVVGREGEIAAEVSAYARSDLLCYRAQGPESLIIAQDQHWEPPLQWAAERIGARLLCRVGVVYHAQPAAALDAVDTWTASHDAFALTALHNMTTLTGSCVLALAVGDGALNAEDAWTAAHIDEIWQASRWGHDDEAAARLAVRQAQFNAAWQFLQLSR